MGRWTPPNTQDCLNLWSWSWLKKELVNKIEIDVIWFDLIWLIYVCMWVGMVWKGWMPTLYGYSMQGLVDWLIGWLVDGWCYFHQFTISSHNLPSHILPSTIYHHLPSHNLPPSNSCFKFGLYEVFKDFYANLAGEENSNT